MTARAIVVGSGASAVHFALTLLKKGRPVTMIDVGRQGRNAVLPDASLDELKDLLPDPVEYLLGARFEAVHLPGVKEEYYGIPPGKSFVFDRPEGFQHRSSGFAPLFSFAQGGLAETWTGGSYPLNDAELAEFPFSAADLMPHYDEVARRIGVSGAVDDLARFMPVHAHLQSPLRLDEHSTRLLESYANARARLNTEGVHFGRSRVATISEALGDRRPCDYLGRCLWGCPHGALYTPSQTLQECRTFPDFEYVSGVEIKRFDVSSDGAVTAVRGREIATGQAREFPASVLALGAGALLSTRIFLESMKAVSGRSIRLEGLMDNRQVLVPFMNLGMIGRGFQSRSYQYHQLGLGLETESPRDYVHGQITTLKTALVHPLIQRLPLDLRTATHLFRSLHGALGLVNVNFRDTRRQGSYVELTDDEDPRLRIHYTPSPDEPTWVQPALSRVRKALRRLNCVVPPGMMQMRPMGASVHYAGTLPMTQENRALTTTPEGESRDVRNVFMVDGATFPFLPAKNITFTLMANATRIAETAF